MKFFSLIKKIFYPFSNDTYKNEEGRNNIELANMQVEQETHDLDLISIPNESEAVEPQTSQTDIGVEPEGLIDLIKDDANCVYKTDYQNKEVPDKNTSEIDNTENGKSRSLLDNKSYMSLAESLTSLMEELEDTNGLSQEELVEIIKSRLQEGFLISGAELILEDKEFNAIRHIPVPPAMIKRGTPIERTIEPGIMVGDRVIRKAKVKIKE